MCELLSAGAVYSRQKKGCQGTRRGNLFELFAVALAKLVDLLRGLQNVLLAGVERMRLARNFKFE